MTEQERVELGEKFEKPGHKSKKFIGFVFMELVLALLAAYALAKQPQMGWSLSAFMIGIVITMGTVALAFNGYQAKLDMYVRSMTMMGKLPKNIKAADAGLPPPRVTPPPPDFKPAKHKQPLEEIEVEGGEEGEF